MLGLSDGADPASSTVLMDILQHVPGVEHVDDGLKSYGKLARTSERPGGWNAATGQWEHFRVAGGNVNLLRHLLDEAAPDRFSFGRPVLPPRPEESVYDIDDLSCKYDAVIVACGAEASRRCAINLDTKGIVAAAAKAVGFREVCVRAYASDNASNESDADGVTLSSSSIAVARCGVFVDGDVVARRAGGGAKLYEAVLAPTAPPSDGAKILETPYVVCSERPLVVVCALVAGRDVDSWRRGRPPATRRQKFPRRPRLHLSGRAKVVLSPGGRRGELAIGRAPFRCSAANARVRTKSPRHWRRHDHAVGRVAWSWHAEPMPGYSALSTKFNALDMFIHSELLA